MSDVKSMIEAGKTSLGIEFGSTRIKAVLVGEDCGSGDFPRNGAASFYWTGLFS